MNEDKLNMFRNRLSKAYKHLARAAARQGVSCCRVYDHDLPEFPLCLELYGDKLYAAEYRRNHGMDEAAHDAWLQQTLQAAAEILQVNPEYIFVKERKRKEDRHGQYVKAGMEAQFFMVEENGLKFLVNLTDYLDTGLFLDHRITRAMVGHEAAGKQVLNLFCYTGSFSVYAAAGGAAGVTSIDLSNTYIDWARRNMELNGFFDGEKHQFIKADVLQYLDELPLNFYDLVILDPPTFSNSKMMKDFFDVQQHHAALINRVLETMKPGGALYFSNNYTKFALDTPLIAATHIRDITRKTTPFDFEKKLKRWCFRIEK